MPIIGALAVDDSHLISATNIILKQLSAIWNNNLSHNLNLHLSMEMF